MSLGDIGSGISSLFTGSGIKQASADQIAALQKGYADYSDLANKATGAVTTQGGQAAGTWQDLLLGANKGSQSYADAMGINGPEGIARARSAFAGITQPSIDMALDAMTRQQKAQGIAGGNILAGESQYATNEMNKQYMNYVAALNPYLNQDVQATSGLAGTYGALGTQLAGIYGNQGQAALGTAQNIGNAQAQGDMASSIGAGNLLNFGLNAAKAAASFTPAGAMGNLASGVGNLFSSGPTAMGTLMTGGSGPRVGPFV